jgi:Rps23 Pro-64 3,4-dihydroxylase Tpa1-like proline 4-hydroxylase
MSKVNVVKNFLDEPLAEQILTEYERDKGKKVFGINNKGLWGTDLDKGSIGPVLVYGLDKYIPYFNEVLPQRIPEFIDHEIISCFLHIWQPGSQINWHDDVHDKSWSELTATIYLTKNWHLNWGGLFLELEEGSQNSGKWIFPEYRTLCWFKPPLWHATTMCTFAAEHPRISIQMFWKKKV